LSARCARWAGLRGWAPRLDSRPCEIGLLTLRVNDPGEAIPRSARAPRPCPGRSRRADSPSRGSALRRRRHRRPAP
jgi:hypothetical protein